MRSGTDRTCAWRRRSPRRATTRPSAIPCTERPRTRGLRSLSPREERGERESRRRAELHALAGPQDHFGIVSLDMLSFFIESFFIESFFIESFFIASFFIESLDMLSFFIMSSARAAGASATL